MKLSMWTGIYHKIDLHKALESLHALGWETFEVSTEHFVLIENSEDADRLIKQANEVKQKRNLFTPQGHSNLYANITDPDPDKRKTDMESIKKHIRIAHRLGVKDIVIHPGSNAELKRDQLFKVNVDSYRELSDIAEEHSITIFIENIPGVFEDSSNVLELIDAIDRPDFGVNFDTSHANLCKLDLVKEIKNYGDKLLGTHISDNDGSGDQHQIPGWGNINWPEVMKAFKEINYKGLFNFEIPGIRHEVQEVADMKTYLALESGKWLLDSGLTSKL